MLLSMLLPPINVHMTYATIKRVHATPGQALSPGAKLIDLRIDLTSAFPQDCPPISYYRIVLRERAWLRSVMVAQGGDVAPGQPLALLSTEDGEPLDGTPVRAVRVSTAGILWQPDWDADIQP
jgi:hypothetical protein